ncbi:putative type IX sorting system protein PorV2 [Pedobacter montanisoli]|uniref:PorV/PorQ family protein n=1 Tax=Pedobacter montanisoli TaxID=2923277 RepID=A0ABS9ZW02_9SPHI|nr:PorV/PorQ family protein [Pedobacter montanisoli]MCJ0742481.1 PorV/PorQ family protein [Pedobacter montanisoli]
MRKPLLFCFFLLSIQSLHAQKRKYSNEFLNIGVGSAAFGMSGSVIANVNDVTSGYWNPAGLARMETPKQVGLMHSEYFSGIAKYDYAAFATSVQDNTAVVGVSAIRFGVDDIPDTSELIDADGNINYDRVKKFSAADYAFIFSYARKSKNARRDFTYGANVKILHRLVGQYGKSYGFGFDAGVQYKTGKFVLAAMGRDITTTFNTWSYNADQLSTVYTQTGNDIPKNSTETTLPRIILGAAYSTAINEQFNIMAEANLNFTTDGKRNVLLSANPISIDPTLGLTVDYKKIISLRAGLGNIQKSTDFTGKQFYSYQPNMGVGVKINNFSIDYALTNIGNSSDALYSNVFSIRIDFSTF